MYHRCLAHDRCAGSCLTTRSCRNHTQDELDALRTFWSRSLFASWAPPPFGGLCGKCPWLSPHRTTLPVRAVQVTAAPCFTGQISCRLMCYLMKTRRAGQQWLNSGSSPASWFPCQRLFANITFFLLSRVCASCESTAIETLFEQEQRVCSSTVPVLLLHTEPEQRSLCGTRNLPFGWTRM